MTYVLPALGPSGAPCPCKVDMDPCGCGSALLTACRTRSGRATLCGFPAWVPTNPPLFFRNYDISGKLTIPGEWENTFSGACSYAQGSCTPAGHGTSIIKVLTTGETTVVELGCTGVGNLTGTESKTPTEYTFLDGYGGKVVRRLSSPDTPAAAISRMRPVPAWSDWSPGSGCCAMIEAAWPSFSFTEAEYRLTLNGESGDVQPVEVKLQQQPLDGKGQISYMTVSIDVAVGSPATLEIPAVVGKMTCVASAKIVT